MAGQILGGGSSFGGGANPLSLMMSGSPLGQLTNGFSSLIPAAMSGIRGQLGQIGQGFNPFTTAAMSSPTNNAPLPTVENTQTNGAPAGGGNTQTFGEGITGVQGVGREPFNQTGYGSQGGWGDQGQNFVSQDERASTANRLGGPADVAAAATNGTSVGPATTTTRPPVAAQPYPASEGSIPPAVRAGIFAGESGGDYNTLYGHNERQGGMFAGTNLTGMTVDQALAFNSPTGPYGSWAARQGLAAAPLGAYQIVHSTLASVKKGLGLTGNELMTPALQERMGNYIYQHQGTGAWAGYHGPADPSQVFQSGETIHLGSRIQNHGAPGGARSTGTNPTPGYGPTVTVPAGANAFGGSGAPNGDYNTALAVNPNSAAYAEAERRARFQRMMQLSKMGAPAPSLPNTQAPPNMSPDINPQAFAAAKSGGHLRALPAIDVMKALGAIGHSYRDQGYISNG